MATSTSEAGYTISWPPGALQTLTPKEAAKARASKTKSTDEAFWAERGVSPKVRDARPYFHWLYEDGEEGTKDVKAVWEGFKGLPDTTRNWLRTKAIDAGSGLVIPRFAPARNYRPIYPEIRPDFPVVSKYTKHFHGHGEKPEPEELHRRFVHKPKNMLIHRWKEHTEPFGKLTKENKRAMKRGEEPGNDENIHIHAHTPKYLFAPSDKLDRWRFSFHEGMDPDDLRRHLEKRHKMRRVRKKKGESDEDYLDRLKAARAEHKALLERLMGIHHPHKKRVKNRKVNYAQRVDVHPWARKRLRSAEVFWFGIEGCLKADAIFSAVLKEGRPDCVFSVPSVSLWEVPCGKRFVKQFLVGKTVYVVPDADWTEKKEVIAQARFCQSYLRRLGVKAYVAAPPAARLHEDIKGVDDFLGKGGGTLDQLEVIERIVDYDAVTAHAVKVPGKVDVVKRAALVLSFIAEHAMIADRSEEGWEDEDGTLAVSYEAMGKIMSETGIYDADPGKRAKRGADDLAEAGMITVTKGTLEIEDERYIPQPDSIRYEWVPNENKRSPRKFVKRQVENPGYYEEEKDDWVDPPTIQIIPELRGRDSRTPLGSFTPFTSPAERRWRKTLFPLAA